MRFTPKTEEEIAADNLWQPGEYGFEILDRVTFGTKEYTTCEMQARSGADMIRLVVKVFNQEGQFQTLIDYIMEAMPAKLRHAAEACGLLAEYETGTLTASQFVGKQGFLKVKIETDKSGQYSPKNAVMDYIPAGTAAMRPESSARVGADDFDSTIPF